MTRLVPNETIAAVTRTSTAVAALLALLLVAATAAVAEGTATTAVTVKAAYNAKLKARIVVDGRGRTLYMYVGDVGSPKPECVNDPSYHCIKAWPALRATGPVHAGPGVARSLLSTVKRGDGSLQVTYAHHPLYYDAGAAGLQLTPDTKPGDVNGQNFNNLWYVLSPSGKAIEKAP